MLYELLTVLRLQQYFRVLLSVSERVPPTTTGVTDGEPTELTTDSVTTASTSPAVDSPAGVKGKLR